jgi:transposase
VGARQSAEVTKALRAMERPKAKAREVAKRFGIALSTLYAALERKKTNGSK